jgi:methionine sulfoxide reductase heme-binding subunit
MITPRRAAADGLEAIAGWRGFKPAVFAACALPLVALGFDFWRAFTGRDPMALGTDPTRTLLHETGQAAITLLLLTLTVTPVRRLLRVNRVQAIRRMLGVWAFTYAAVHLSVYLVFDSLCYSLATCDGRAIWADIVKRPFILAGATGFVVLLALAITSTSGWMRRLKKNWTRLHRLVYVAAIAGVVHFIWIQKSGIRRPGPWIIWLAAVLGVRVYFAASRWLVRRASAVRA